MAKGYASAAVDFDDLFDPDVVGDGPSATGYASAGVALRYAALKYGTKRADVGYCINGVDVSTLWAAKGTAAYVASPPTFNNLSFTHSDYTAQGGSARITFNLGSAGGWSAAPRTGVAPANYSGRWYGSSTTPGIGAQYEARFTITKTTTRGSFTNGASAWTAIGSGAGLTAQFDLTAPGTAGADYDASFSCLVEIRKVGTTQVISSGTFGVLLNAGSTGGGN